jgi:hypothetical protein
MNSANTKTKLFTVSITAMIILSVMMIVTTFLTPNMPVQKASAQMMGQQQPSSGGTMGPGMMGSSPMMMRNQNFTGMMGPGMMMPAAAPPNVTGSISISSLIGNALASQIKVSLSQANDSAEKAVGNNTHAIAAHLGQANGYLVYTVWVVDGSFKLHRAIVDPGNGKVLSSQQLPMRPGMMMGLGMMGGGGTGMGMMMGPSQDMMMNRDMMDHDMEEMMQNDMMGSEEDD